MTTRDIIADILSPHNCGKEMRGILLDQADAIIAARPDMVALQAENKRLRDALETLVGGYGPNHLSRFVERTARAALSTATKPQEGGE